MKDFLGADLRSIVYLVLGLFIVFGIFKGLFKLVAFIVIAAIVIGVINFLF